MLDASRNRLDAFGKHWLRGSFEAGLIFTKEAPDSAMIGRPSSGKSVLDAPRFGCTPVKSEAVCLKTRAKLSWVFLPRAKKRRPHALATQCDVGIFFHCCVFLVGDSGRLFRLCLTSNGHLCCLANWNADFGRVELFWKKKWAFTLLRAFSYLRVSL